MAVKPSWLLNEEQRWDQMPSRLAEEQRWLTNLKQSGVLVPDTRLQAIADAWNYDDIGQGRYEFRQQWPELADLLDALTAEEGQ